MLLYSLWVVTKSSFHSVNIRTLSCSFNVHRVFTFVFDTQGLMNGGILSGFGTILDHKRILQEVDTPLVNFVDGVVYKSTTQ